MEYSTQPKACSPDHDEKHKQLYDLIGDLEKDLCDSDSDSSLNLSLTKSDNERLLV